MALTPSTIRSDLKCGKGAISEGEKCSKGPARKRVPAAGAKEKFLGKVGTIGFAGSMGYTAVALAKGNINHTLGGLSAAMASSSAYSASQAMGYERKGQKAKAMRARLQSGVAAGYAGVGVSLLAQHAIARRAYVRNVANSNGSYRGTAGGNGPFGTGGGSYSSRAGGYSSRAGGYSPPRRGYQGDPFKDLGVSSRASASELKAAWKKQMMVHHPDSGGNPETAKKINAAYQAILKSRGIKDSIYADGFEID